MLRSDPLPPPAPVPASAPPPHGSCSAWQSSTASSRSRHRPRQRPGSGRPAHRRGDRRRPARRRAAAVRTIAAPASALGLGRPQRRGAPSPRPSSLPQFFSLRRLPHGGRYARPASCRRRNDNSSVCSCRPASLKRRSSEAICSTTCVGTGRSGERRGCPWCRSPWFTCGCLRRCPHPWPRRRCSCRAWWRCRSRTFSRLAAAPGLAAGPGPLRRPGRRKADRV